MLEKVKEQAERAQNQYGMVVLPGFEVTKNSMFNHRSAHILAIGLDRYVSADQDPLSVAREIRSQGGLAIAAHPVHTGSKEPQTFFLWNRRHEYADEFDAWEVASGPVFYSEVQDSGLPQVTFITAGKSTRGKRESRANAIQVQYSKPFAVGGLSLFIMKIRPELN